MRWMKLPGAVSVVAMACVLVLASAGELAARGGRGGGGGMGRGGFSRGGAARSGSIGGYPGTSRGGGTDYRRAPSDRSPPRQRSEPRNSQSGDSRSNDGSFETRRGNTVDWESDVVRGDDGFERNTSWESSSGASGSGSSEVRVKDGEVQSVDRSRHVESASGETLDRDVSSHREGDWVVREGNIKTSTGVDADTASTIRKTDDGYVARGAVSGKHGAAAGTIVRDGDDLYVRGGRIQGDDASWGRVHCNNGRCTGGRVTADIDDYYVYPYYYYPYYYGWYSCPSGSVQTWSGAYGTPVYGCRHVTVVQTTIALGPSDSSRMLAGDSASSPSTPSNEARVTSAPVLMYEIDPTVVVYSTDYRPEGIAAVKKGERYYWTPGPKDKSREVEKWASQASAMAGPTANATLITYTIGSRTVYLTNERPAPGFFAEPSDQLFAWIPGVRDPTQADRESIGTAIAAHRAGGRQALDREARKLEDDHAPPPRT